MGESHEEGMTVGLTWEAGRRQLETFCSLLCTWNVCSTCLPGTRSWPWLQPWDGNVVMRLSELIHDWTQLRISVCCYQTKLLRFGGKMSKTTCLMAAWGKCLIYSKFLCLLSLLPTKLEWSTFFFFSFIFLKKNFYKNLCEPNWWHILGNKISNALFSFFKSAFFFGLYLPSEDGLSSRLHLGISHGSCKATVI